jgi:NAD+ diphosphatase
MHDIHPYRPNAMAGNPLDRVGMQRTDTAWVQAALSDPTTRFLPVWRAKNLLAGVAEGRPEAVMLAPDALPGGIADRMWALLGTLEGQAVFAIDVSLLDDPLRGFTGGSFEDLRRIGGTVKAPDASMLAHARGMMHWRRRHRFCGVCGAACVPGSAGHVMHCQGCGTHHFPRTDPAVIMLVTSGDRVLLGQPTAFRNYRVFTTLAGFVEPGESLEEAVAREVFEETGIRVAQARYHSSQPWPFPSSIMLGFRAQAVTTDITIDPHEIVEARWFTREELRQADGFVLPPDFSIARRLIDDWMAE